MPKTVCSPSNTLHRMATIFVAVCCVVCLEGCQPLTLRDSVDSLLFRDANERASNRANLHNQKGLKYLEKGKLAKAETHFHKAVEIDANSAAAHNNLGNLFLSRHEMYQAAWEFERASQIAPTLPEPLINLGLIFEQINQLDEAAEYYRNALEIAPNNAIAVGNYARVLIKQDEDPLEIHRLLSHLMLIDNRREWLDWADMLLSTRYRIPPNSIRDQTDQELSAHSNSQYRGFDRQYRDSSAFETIQALPNNSAAMQREHDSLPGARNPLRKPPSTLLELGTPEGSAKQDGETLPLNQPPETMLPPFMESLPR